MPVDLSHKIDKKNILYQRDAYDKSVITKEYWDYRDRQVFKYIESNHLKIVDVGSGEGITLERLIKEFPGRKIVGVDYSKENIAICSRHNLPVLHSDVYDLPFESNSIDICIFLEVIEHLDKPEMALREIQRILRVGGRTIIIFPNDFTFKIARVMTGKLREAFYDAGHTRQWMPKSLAHLLKETGFRIVAQKNIPFVFWLLSLHHITVADKLQEQHG
jgi:ubiquinone/menaquinone biosynthesis C-methylase UbiE